MPLSLAQHATAAAARQTARCAGPASDVVSAARGAERLSPWSRVGAVGQHSHGTLHLVDLAGSERLAKSKAEGAQLKEAQVSLIHKGPKRSCRAYIAV